MVEFLQCFDQFIPTSIEKFSLFFLAALHVPLSSVAFAKFHPGVFRQSLGKREVTMYKFRPILYGLRKATIRRREDPSANAIACLQYSYLFTSFTKGSCGSKPCSTCTDNND